MTEPEIAGLQRIGTHLVNRSVDREELGQICSSAFQNKIGLKHYLQSVAHMWSADQRKTIMQACFLVASINGELRPDQLQLLRDVQRVLELTDEEFQTVIEETIE